MAELWAKDRLYDVLRRYVDWCTRRSYRWIRQEGKIPSGDQAYIIAPNHTNTLMDALVVLQSDRQPIGFGARADVFKNPLAAKWLRRARIVPIARQRDGLREVAKNLDVMQEVSEVLHHGMPFCLFPEGRHNPKHSLLPINKGLVRLAVQNFRTGQPTSIVPAGIDFSDFFHYRGTCTLKYGEPIDVGAFVESHKDLNLSDLYHALSAEMAERIKSLILYIPDDENYERRLEELRPTPPRRWWEIPLAVLTAPIFLAASVLSLPQWAIAEHFCHRKIKDPAFRNTARFALRMVGTPVMLLIWAALGFIFLPPLAACGLLVFYMCSYSIFYDWLNLLRINY